MYFRKEYTYLSNMYYSPIKINGLYFSCAEAAFQSFKTIDLEIRKKFQFISGPEAKRLGRKVPLRPDWNNIRIEVMDAVVRAKFRQHPELVRKLIVLEEPIVEDNNWNDTFWGKCKGKGYNHLGIILSKIRSDAKYSN